MCLGFYTDTTCKAHLNGGLRPLDNKGKLPTESQKVPLHENMQMNADGVQVQ